MTMRSRMEAVLPRRQSQVSLGTRLSQISTFAVQPPQVYAQSLSTNNANVAVRLNPPFIVLDSFPFERPCPIVGTTLETNIRRCGRKHLEAGTPGFEKASLPASLDQEPTQAMVFRFRDM
ncbi:hypothetical protein CIRG_02610 [Coccidioides immitis RMSCC 2394]|uniref:Uncharacterized protein n=1 Tax=Coccidioides immitis RMSCC 2394 TaxID=404692 RepID=A0A0J6Y793_COCIT|nr:hypothetical protein CIRG_02610 [Coccidioides immitis RMSCC 2394]